MTTALGKYELVAEIARGGMGIVYLAIARGPARFNKLLVVKELKPEFVKDPEFFDMFLEEARLAARLNHPNIVQTYEVGAEGDRHYIVMEYLEGASLAAILRTKGPGFDLGLRLRVLSEVLQGLEYAHNLTDFDGTTLEIVHRDATPQNVFVTYDGQVRVVDFGIAKSSDSLLETRVGVLKGKPGYMPPEQLKGQVDRRADVFSVGVMLWEVVAGRRMWRNHSDMTVLTQLMSKSIPKIREAKPDVDPRLADIVDKATAPEPDARYSSAREFGDALDSYLADSKMVSTSRDIGRVVSELFANDRVSRRAAIDERLAAIRDGVADREKLPSIRPPGLEVGTPSGASSNWVPPSQTQPQPILVYNSDGKKKQGLLLLLLGVIVFLLVGISAMFIFGRSDKDPNGRDVAIKAVAPQTTDTAVGTLQQAAIPPATTLSTTATSHEISVSASPPAATIAFNGITYASPAKTQCREPMTLRVSAPGYAARERSIDCSKDEAIELVLSPLPAAPLGFPRPPPPPMTTASKPAAASAPDCNPPFYFEGTKKVFKSGCL